MEVSDFYKGFAWVCDGSNRIQSTFSYNSLTCKFNRVTIGNKRT